MDKLRHLLITAAVAATLLAGTPPAEARSIWLKCGEQEINLDCERERFSLAFVDKVYQGRAMFSPGQIDFEFNSVSFPRGGGIRFAYSIDRKSLKYTQTSLFSIDGDRYEPQISDKFVNPRIGTCSIMKQPPTAGNKI